MKRYLILAAFILLARDGLALRIKKGKKIDRVTQSMMIDGYTETSPCIELDDQDLRAKSWRVGSGVVTLVYLVESGKITAISFSLFDERPKGIRKTFDFDVETFDTRTGRMMIRVQKNQSSESPSPTSP